MDARNSSKKARIAHLSGPTATIQNTPPLVTSNKARAKHGLPLLTDVDGAPLRHDALRAAAARGAGQGLCRAVLRPSAGIRRGRALRAARRIHRRGRRVPEGAPERQRQGGLRDRAEAGRRPLSAAVHGACRPTAQPGRRNAPRRAPPPAAKASSPTARAASRRSIACRSASTARRACCRRSQPSTSTAACRRAASPRACRRICAGTRAKATSPPEVRGTHFFGYKPYHLAVAPPRPALAKATNDMQALVSSGDYDGVIWTQGSPQVEESAYWFNLLIDTDAADLRQRRAASAGPDQRRRPGEHRRLRALHPDRASGPTSRAATAAASW